MRRRLSPLWLWLALHRVVSGCLEVVRPWLIAGLESVVRDGPRYIGRVLVRSFRESWIGGK